jgi:hypothetical protein
MIEIFEANQAPLAARPAIAPPSFAMPRNIADIQVLGQMMIDSGFFKDVRSVSQACVKIIAGAALGYDPFTSMNAFHIIEGKVTPTAGEIAARIKRSGKYDFRIDLLEDRGCVLSFTQSGALVGQSSFVESDAKAAGLANKDVWKKYARNMYFARALTNGARWYCAEVFGGPVYTAEELGADVAMGADGEMRVVEASSRPAGTGGASVVASVPARPTNEQTRELVALAKSLGIELGPWLAKNVAPDFADRKPRVLTLEEHERACDLLDMFAPLEPTMTAQKADEESQTSSVPRAVVEAERLDALHDFVLRAGHVENPVPDPALGRQRRALRTRAVILSKQLWPNAAECEIKRHQAEALHRVPGLTDAVIDSVSIDALESLVRDLELRANPPENPRDKARAAQEPEDADSLLDYAHEKGLL